MSDVWTGSAKQKAALREMFGGRCAYCGEILTKMQADHRDPVTRVQTDGYGRRLPAAQQRMMNPERNRVSNMMPSCQPCNNHKGGMKLEEWRGVLSRAPEILSRDKSIFRAAIRFRIVEVSSAPVVFFLEREAMRLSGGAK